MLTLDNTMASIADWVEFACCGDVGCRCEACPEQQRANSLRSMAVEERLDGFHARFTGPLIGGVCGLGSFEFEPTTRNAVFRLCVDGVADGRGHVTVRSGPCR